MILLDNITGNKAKYKTIVDVSYKDKLLSFAFEIHHCSNNSYTNIDNGEVYNGDAFEIFFSDNSNKEYFEFEVAPNGTKYFSLISNNGEDITHKLLDTSLINVDIKNINNILYIKGTINLSSLINKDIDLKYNVYRIETDNEMTNKYLFSLHPNMTNSFHFPVILK